MKVLVVYCHPCEQSFNAAVRDAAIDALEKRGQEVHLVDLYAAGFDPVMSLEEWRRYFRDDDNFEPIRDQAQHVLWAEAVVFIYPTWWYGLPAMLKGWLERVMVPGFAFEITASLLGPRPKLRHINRLLVLTTCGASPLLSWVMGQPGRRTLLRGFRSLCSTVCRTKYVALYNMDSVSESRKLAHLDRVRNAVAAFVG